MRFRHILLLSWWTKGRPGENSGTMEFPFTPEGKDECMGNAMNKIEEGFAVGIYLETKYGVPS